MHDADIRKILHEVEMKRICTLDPTTRVIDGLGIFEGKFRIDVAVVNGFLHGYEIKSAEDNLDRLQSQQAAYNQVFDKLTLVADEHHVEEAMKLLPPWWGLMVAGIRNGVPYVDEIWTPRLNPQVDPFAICQLLWKEEAMSILQQRKLSAGLWTSRRKVLWEKLTASMDLNELKEIVRETLKGRENWREGTGRRRRRKKRAKTSAKAGKSAAAKQSSRPLSKKAQRMAEGAMRNAILTYGL
ncbi:MAG TPA: sce7726 family protein [Candidatus Melainabacteria bacterium]|nr:sce7726 family protein [Candidatus Melainabacteria bacterium]